MTSTFFTEELQKTGSRLAQAKLTSKIILDKNEQAIDVDDSLKMKLAESLLNTNWNRYPSADHSNIEAQTAAYCNLNPENILLGSGTATIITTLLNYFAINNKKITIAQPSYSLFEYHCKTYNIKYEPWYLNKDLEFDYENMPVLDKDSVLIITSPNNPTGNTLDIDKLVHLLETYPDSCIILDNVYSEFCSTSYTQLINKYQNLIVLRSFSKAFPIAGLRLGYLCATASTVSVVRKLILQFSINPLALIFANEILFDEVFMADAKKRVLEIIHQREKMRNFIMTQFDDNLVTVFPSQGNFLLIRVHDDTIFQNLLEDLSQEGISVLNTASFVLLQNTFRVSVGTAKENKTFLHCFINSVESNLCINDMLMALAKAG